MGKGIRLSTTDASGNTTLTAAGQARLSSASSGSKKSVEQGLGIAPLDPTSSGPVNTPTQDSGASSTPTGLTPKNQINPLTPPSNPTQAENPVGQSNTGTIKTVGQGATIPPIGTGSATSFPAPVQNAIDQAQAAIRNSKIPPPQDGGQARSIIQSNTPKTPPQPTSPAVDNFFNTNPTIQQSNQDIMDFLMPENVRTDLLSQLKRVTSAQNSLADDKAQLMDINRVMAGTEEDLRDEVTKANGFATDSQIQALTIARNKTLLKKASYLQDQVSIQQDAVKNATDLLNFEKDLANTQFTQRLGVLNYQQQNNQFMYNATQQTFKNVVDALGYDGAYQAYSQDPAQLARIEQISGLGSGGFAQAAEQAKTDRAAKLEADQLDLKVKQSQLLTDAAQREKIIWDMNHPNGYSSGDVVDLLLRPNLKTTISGTQYVDGTNLTGKDAGEAMRAAAENGVPYLGKDQADLQANIDTARRNMANISNSILNLLPESGTDKKRFTNLFTGITQVGANSEELASFNAYRSAAIQALRAMAGAKGLRINQAEIQTSMDNDIPKITDTRAVAQAKLAKVQSLLDSQEQSMFGNRIGVQPSGQTVNSPKTTSPEAADAKGDFRNYY